ncbi:MAG: TPM domain-containing protein [Thiobacillaceae bacterium]|nr:TPM domain-containing protein [Thiobacillaceae bacterium]MCX7672650.1 TPM domain-containing protein [Thiobacillaceae bacterium]MDW8323664.1 TPM domain-containing protein [Burkholderiales bacterium]
MKLGRVLKHLLYPDWLARRAFPPAVMARIERAIADSEAQHRGELRFAVEASLPLIPLLSGCSARARALAVFAELGVWDTEENNGVLIYLLMADRDVEIVADRGIARQVPAERWQAICAAMEAHFRAGRHCDGVLAGIAALTALLRPLYPRSGEPVNELPDRPVRLD